MFGHSSPFSGVVVGPLERHVALLYFSQDIVGDGLELPRPVLYREPLDDPELHIALGDLILEKRLQDSLRFLGDIRADAVAAQDADHNGPHLRVVNTFRIRLDTFDPGQLLLQDLAKMLLGCLDRLYVYHHSLLWSGHMRGPGPRSSFLGIKSAISPLCAETASTDSTATSPDESGPGELSNDG